VVFHCALSQQRGPGAALRYLRERERLGLLDEEVVKGAVTADTKKEGGEGETDVVEILENKEDSETVEKKVTQKVYVLDGGFVKWQEKYGTDERLTEGYAKDIWADGYWA